MTKFSCLLNNKFHFIIIVKYDGDQVDTATPDIHWVVINFGDFIECIYWLYI